ncbi:MAG TPA: hypothetical protein VIL85_23555 [Thermomicrobiales bacterium]
MRATWRAEAERWAPVSAHLPLNGSGRFGAALGASRKAVRLLLRWYINPIVEQQNHFNAALLSLDALNRAREQELVREIAELRARVTDLERAQATNTPPTR